MPEIWANRQFSHLLETVRHKALEFRAQRRISADVVELFRKVGVYRALVPACFGGMEASPAEFLEMVEAIATADGSAGWVASFGVSATYLAALPLDTLKELYGNGPDVVFAGAIFPPQPATVSGDGIIVNGRWRYASGCTGASLIGVGVSVAGEVGKLPRMAVMPADKVTIEETWDTIGLAGTGSHDVVVRDVYVPKEWTFIRGGAPSVHLPVYDYPSLSLAAQVLAVVGLGCARRALDELTRFAMGSTSITGAPVLADRSYVQSAVARCEAELTAVRHFFYDETRSAWQDVLAGRAVSEETSNRLRLAATSIAQVSARVAHECYAMGGIVATERDNILARCMLDSLVVAQHAFLARGNYEAAGRILLGRGGRPGYP
ncbi:acyl-CoA dehydrogenase family protein [Komagataeibacter xylinus]|uniref:Flavin-dependent monooxygenase n=1 Tax=Komagataeibacter xylinus TaxID=28448 RepID=A0A857FP81_KOMXY|nr:acyl-CoA dehydrogenase family protein [Komagataeibacter xylinus]QHC35992.1 flavin-dependent monooxygenase [Komagataeibacter xylinus]